MANIQYYDVILKPVVTEKEYGTYGEKKKIHFRVLQNSWKNTKR